ncbi:MAG: efflux RND transporter periplasmic adaptor subunit [Bacteroidales bacterium]|nr:efflux RND transporter periplasmic adaptor subunit [Bacteroidales bacterium]
MSKVGIAILCLVVFGIGFVVSRAVEKQNEEIETISMERRNIEKTLVLSGTIEPERVIDVRSSISGNLSRLMVNVGDVVRQGDPLASVRFVKDPIEVRRLRDNIEVSKKKLDVVTAQYERSKSLHEEGYLSDEEFESVSAEYASMKKNHETLAAELAMVTGEQTSDMISNIINATNSGTIIELPIKEGGSVMARGSYSEGSVIARIADFGSMTFQGDVSEVDVDKIKVGTPMTITIATSSEAVLKGTISSISPTASRTKGITTYKVYATVDLTSAGETHVYSGSSATGRITTAKADSVWTLDEKYLHYNGNTVYVETVDENGKIKRPCVELGLSDGQYTEIVSGVDSLTRIKEIEK